MFPIIVIILEKISLLFLGTAITLVKTKAVAGEKIGKFYQMEHEQYRDLLGSVYLYFMAL